MIGNKKLEKDKLEERRKIPHQHEGRDPYLRDKGRILHSAFFRRLQAKKQILDYYINDFSRTRLTHSLEVAQIAVGICEELKKKNPEKQEIFPENFCIEAIALTHDLGHPPNGHAGETALNYCMEKRGGYEGNAQTLRIAGKLGEGEEEGIGLNLTRATMLGILKYPIFYSQYQKEYSPQKSDYPNFDSFTPPKCIFDEENKLLEWIFNPMEEDFKTLKKLQEEVKVIALTEVNMLKKKQKRAMNFFASIMDLADDIAYGIHDFEDGVALGLLSKESIENSGELKNNYEKIEKYLKLSWQDFCRDVFEKDKRSLKMVISRIVHLLISNCEIKKKDCFEYSILDCFIDLPEEFKNLLESFKYIVKYEIIKKRENRIIDFQLQNIIVKVFECFRDNLHLLPKKYKEKIYQSGQEKNLRPLCDYLAGMTDKYLVKIYKGLFIPDSITIFDRL